MRIQKCLRVIQFSGVFIVTIFTMSMVVAQSGQQWVLTDFDKQFKFIYARNNMLVGIEAQTNLPYRWDKPAWKKIGNDAFVTLVTDGNRVAGVKQSDQCAYYLSSTSWLKIGQQFNLSIEQLAFGARGLIARGKNPYGFTYGWSYPWDSTSLFCNEWKNFGSQKLWSFDVAGPIACGVQQSYANDKLNNLACIWNNTDWVALSAQKFQQVVTNGTTIFGVGLTPKTNVFQWNGKVWSQLGSIEKFTQIAANNSILCGIQEKNQMMLLWLFGAQKWIALDTKKFTMAATDGKFVYGIGNDNRVYYWQP